MTATTELLASTNSYSAIAMRSDGIDYRQLFRNYYSVLCEKAYRMVGCRQKAEEIVSDVFIKIWKNREELNIKSSIKAYLFMAVRNRSIDYLRHLSRRKIMLAELCPADHESSHYPSPEECLLYRELEQQIQTAISALPPRGQHIFRLSREEGLKYQQIADQLGISIKTVETHMRRSLIFLRARLQSLRL